MMLELFHALLAIAALLLPLLLAWVVLAWGKRKPPTKPPRS